MQLKPAPAKARAEPCKILNSRLFEAPKQVLEGVKTLAGSNKKLGEKPQNKITIYLIPKLNTFI